MQSKKNGKKDSSVNRKRTVIESEESQDEVSSLEETI